MKREAIQLRLNGPFVLREYKQKQPDAFTLIASVFLTETGKHAILAITLYLFGGYNIMKRSICIFFLLTVLSVGFLSAKVKLSLDIGPVYTYFASRSTVNNGRTDTWSTHTGGLNVLFGAEFVKNFGVYGTVNFAFGKRIIEGTHIKDASTSTSTITRWNGNLTYVIDSQFGFFYVFHPIKKMDLTLGAGIGIGGSGRNYTRGNEKIAKSQTNIGGGINLNISYMFTKMIGIYGGISDTIYAPVYTKRSTRYSNDKTETIEDSNTSGKIANSLNIKAGIKIVF